MSVVKPAQRRPGRTFYRYVAWEIATPTAFALLGLTAVVLTRDFMGLSELVINRGIATLEVLKIALFEAVPLAAQMFPFSVLIGCLVALGRLGADREVLALESLGVTAAALVWPVTAFAALMTAASFFFSVVAAPWASRELDASLDRISRAMPWANVRAGQVNEFGGWQLEAREVSARGDELRDVLLWMPRLAETVFAREGQMTTDESGAIEITLRDGSALLKTDSGPRQVRFDQLRTTLPESDQPVVREEEDRLQSLSLEELDARARAFTPSDVDHLPRAELTLLRRYALPAATLVFGFLAAPLFFQRANFSRAGGGVMGLLCTIFYYGLVQLGEGLLQGGKIGPVTAVWMPNAVLGLLALGLVVRARGERVLGLAFDRPQPRRPDARRSGDSAAARPFDRRLRRYPLPRYIAGRFIQLSVMAFASLLVAYLLIDIMERIQWFAKYEATGGEIIRYYGARIPILASRVIPMALLVATSLTVSLLAVEGELIGLRSCGIPAPRALMPVLLISALVAPAYLLMNNIVVPRANELVHRLKRTEIKDEYLARSAARRRAPVWVHGGSLVVEAWRFDSLRGRAQDLTIYEMRESGEPLSRTDARAARHIGNGVWRLTEPSRVEVSGNHLLEVSPQIFAELGDALRVEVDTRHLSVVELAREIEEVEANGYDATLFRVDFHMRFAEALSCIVLPATALFFAVGGPPFPGPAQTLLVSGVLGVGYILLTGVSASLGYGKSLPTALGGWGPTLVFSTLAGFFGLRLIRRL